MPLACKRILIPKIVSFNVDSVRGYQREGTKAFAPVGTRLPKNLSKGEKAIRLRDFAHDSSHYIKTVSPRARRIRGMLQKDGIRIEKELVDLKNGTALFEREGFGLDSEKGMKIFIKNPLHFIEQIEKIVAKMHSLGIVHDHLHIGNFAVTEEGELILLDLGRVRSFSFPEKPRKDWAYRKFYNDLWNLANSFVAMYTVASEARVLAYPQERETLRDAIVLSIVSNYSPELKKVAMIDFDKLTKWK